MGRIQSGWNEVAVALQQAKDWRIAGLVSGPHQDPAVTAGQWLAWAEGPDAGPVEGYGATPARALGALGAALRRRFPKVVAGYPEHDTPEWQAANAQWLAARERTAEAFAVYARISDEIHSKARKVLMEGRHKSDPTAWNPDRKDPAVADLVSLEEDAATEYQMRVSEEREARGRTLVAGRQVVVIHPEGDREARQQRLAAATSKPGGVMRRLFGTGGG